MKDRDVKEILRRERAALAATVAAMPDKWPEDPIRLKSRALLEQIVTLLGSNAPIPPRR